MDDVKPQKIQKYGWKRDLPDARDLRYSSLRERVTLPSKVDMREGFSAVQDQGSLGSCTAHAALAIYQFTAKEQNQKAVNFSRLYQYYNSRILEGTVDWDSGATIRNSIKAINKYGVCPESILPYAITKFDKKPTKDCYDYGSTKLLKFYARVNQLEYDIKACLAQNNPISFGFTVYESFEGEEVAKTGVMKMPLPSESVMGGHAVVLCGYDDAKRLFLVRNSWGKNWGDKGYFWMPYEYVLNPDLSDDFWTVIQVPN